MSGPASASFRPGCSAFCDTSQGSSCRAALGRLLRSAGCARGRPIPDPALDVEDRIVIRALPLDVAVFGRLQPFCLEQFLKVRLGLGIVDCQGRLGLDPGFDQTAGRLQTAVNKHGADHGLEGVGEERLFVAPPGTLFATAEPEGRAEFQAPCAACQGLRAHNPGLDARQIAFRRQRSAVEEPAGRDESKHRVAQELEALVLLLQALFVGVGGVGQGLLEQRAILEPVAEPLLDLIGRRRQG